MSTNTPTTTPKVNYTISLASEADLPTLVDIQFKVFNFFPPEVLANGQDTPANQAKVVERHRDDMRRESGLRIAKVETVPDPSSNDTKTIIGFCMFCLPNEDASDPIQKIPRSVRPRAQPIEATFIDDPVRRAQVSKQMNTTYQAIQAVIAGRPCAWMRYMSILPAYQRQGIGKALLQWGLKLVDEIGCNTALLASEAGQGLYRAFGFEVVGMNYFNVEGDENHVKQVVETPIMWRNAVPRSDARSIDPPVELPSSLTYLTVIDMFYCHNVQAMIV